jgi:hypothetical protein
MSWSSDLKINTTFKGPLHNTFLNFETHLMGRMMSSDSISAPLFLTAQSIACRATTSHIRNGLAHEIISRACFKLIGLKLNLNEIC